MEDFETTSITGSRFEGPGIDQNTSNDSQSMDLRLPPSGSPSLLSSSSSSPTGNKSQKRKRSADSVLDHEISGWKGSYNSKYHRLLNQTIKDLTLDPLWTDRSDLGPGQVGISRWSPLEKEFLFRGLVSYGRENLPAIATLVGSKSELEVHVYLQLLQETNVKLHTYGDKQSLMMGADVPAAIEVSAECCALLEQTADSLALMQQRYEEHQEKKTQPNLWKLDQNATAWVNDCLSKGEEGIVEVRQRLPAAELLDLGRFLELSKKLFMNSDDPGYNFRTFVSRCEKPSILHTAFSDLYSVMLSTTKRIIQSSLIFAMSRLRATQSPYYSHKRAVKVVDVLAALSVLGMEKNAKEHWVKLPRRCKLSIHNHANRTGYEGAMSYHEVESILGRTATTETVLAGESQSEPANSESPEVSLSDTDLVSATSSSQNRTASPKLVLSHSNATSESTPPAKGCDERADEYLEGIDREANRSGELRLWKMLRKEPPPELLSKYPTSKPKSPESYGQYKHDLDDWGGWTNFEPEWETYGFSLLSEDTVENRTRVQSRSAEFLRASGNKRCVGLYQERATSRSPTPRDAIETE